VEIDYIKAPLNKYTFTASAIRLWVERHCAGKVLNLFAGKIRLKADEVRVDTNKETQPEFVMDALTFVLWWNGPMFDTVILDPPYSHRKSMEMYNGHVSSPFNNLKDNIHLVLNKFGSVITFGYHSVSMGERRGFY